MFEEEDEERNGEEEKGKECSLIHLCLWEFEDGDEGMELAST